LLARKYYPFGELAQVAMIVAEVQVCALAPQEVQVVTELAVAKKNPGKQDVAAFTATWAATAELATAPVAVQTPVAPAAAYGIVTKFPAAQTVA